MTAARSLFRSDELGARKEKEGTSQAEAARNLAEAIMESMSLLGGFRKLALLWRRIHTRWWRLDAGFADKAG